MRFSISSLLLVLLPVLASAAKPVLTIYNTTNLHSSLSNGDSFVMHFTSTGYAYSMLLNGRELVKNAKGGYTDTGGKVVFNFTTRPQIIQQTDSMLEVAYNSYLGTVHYILFSGLPGFYQYVVNANLGTVGEVRSVYRFDPFQFTHGRTKCRNAPLPLQADILKGYKVQDETWQKPDGSYITKYDFSCFVRDLDFHGVYGNDIGAWVIAPGKDYYIGDQLKQELMLHRESITNDTVLLHMYHGTHYNSEFENIIPPGKMWGPWLVYFNDGNLSDASDRAQKETMAWPYSWVKDAKYSDRGDVNGTLILSDGRPASGAAVFLGDEGNTNNQGTTYQYTSYADNAWANGGNIGDVQTVFSQSNITLSAKSTNLGSLTWATSGRQTAWQIGSFDRKTLGFKYGGVPMQHGLTDNCPANLIYAIGFHNTSDWYFAQSAQGNWTVLFDIGLVRNRTATLSLSFAGYTSQNGYGLGHDSLTLPELVPTGLNISMNENYVATVVSETATDGAIYRSANTAGGYYYSEFVIPTDVLIDGPNRLDLTTTQNHRWRGIMWDALKFEWN